MRESLVLPEGEWRARQQAHRDRVEPWVAPRLARRRQGQSQATDDFLFEYYPYSVGRLRTWHPGLAVGAPALEQAVQVTAASTAVRTTLSGVRP